MLQKINRFYFRQTLPTPLSRQALCAVRLYAPDTWTTPPINFNAVYMTFGGVVSASGLSNSIVAFDRDGFYGVSANLQVARADASCLQLYNGIVVVVGGSSATEAALSIETFRFSYQNNGSKAIDTVQKYAPNSPSVAGRYNSALAQLYSSVSLIEYNSYF